MFFAFFRGQWLSSYQKTVVGAGGKVEILSPDLPSGTRVEVIVLVEPVEQDTTEYLLSTEANRTHLRQALRDLENPASYILVPTRQGDRQGAPLP